MMKKKMALSLIAAGLFFYGCGRGSSSDDTTITVERGPVVNAMVVDSKGVKARELGGGKYQFNGTPSYPVMAVGGFIDINGDGRLSEGDITNTLIYDTLDGKGVTIVSTIAQNSDIKEYLKTTYDLTDEEIANDLPQNNKIIAAISDAVFEYCIKNQIYNPKNLTLDELKTLEPTIEEQLNIYNQVQNRAEVEQQLIQKLNLPTLSADDIEEIAQTGNNVSEGQLKLMVQQLPQYPLTQEDKEALAHMWNEEKLAHDVYLALYDLYPNNTLYTIAQRSEAQHQASVEDLIAKYDLNILSPDFSGGYDPEALAQFGLGEFSIDSIKELYNTLYDLGKNSEIDALKVGCMVEVTDINDLNTYINSGQLTPDMMIVFTNLRDGSYHHYWAFDKALKAKGVIEGCCSAGEEYCKTPEEYPIFTGTNGNGYGYGNSNSTLGLNSNTSIGLNSNSTYGNNSERGYHGGR
jgi:hypothetical protein